MDFLTAFRISAAGLSAQRTRVNLVASNLANAETTRTAQGGPYRRRDPILAAVPMEHGFESELQAAVSDRVLEVQVVGIQADPDPPRLVYDPHHPDANADGYVAMPNIDVVSEMTNLITASRSYEANATALSTIKQMIQQALSIGR